MSKIKWKIKQYETTINKELKKDNNNSESIDIINKKLKDEHLRMNLQ